jgi:hypothetical protein
MTTATIRDFSAWSERDSVFWYVQEAFCVARRTMVLFLLLPPLIVAATFLAQMFPFRIIKTVKQLNNCLPNEKDTDNLMLIRDILKLLRESSALYGKLCLFRARMAEAVSEIDETIDSLNLVLSDGDSLKDFLVSAEQRRSPDLPLKLGGVSR